MDIFFKSILSSQTSSQVLFEQVQDLLDSLFSYFAHHFQFSLLLLDFLVLLPILGISLRESCSLCPLKHDCLLKNMHAVYLLLMPSMVLQHEIVLSMQYAATEMANCSFLVRHYKNMEGESLVFWTPEDEQVNCSCKEFEHSGILCRHSARVLVLKNYF